MCYINITLTNTLGVIMSNTTVTDQKTAIKAILRFSGTYGLTSVVMTSTMRQRFDTRADIALYSDHPSLIGPVILKNVLTPNVVVHNIATIMNINFMLRRVDATDAEPEKQS